MSAAPTPSSNNSSAPSAFPPARRPPTGPIKLERVNCLGACALAPLAVIDGRYHGRMTEAKVEALLAGAQKGRDG